MTSGSTPGPLLDEAAVPDADDIELPALSRAGLAAKRTLDLVVAGPMLVLLAPLMMLIALAIKLTSRGPILFKQERVGKGGKAFTILKFRTMADGTHDVVRNDPQLWAEYVTRGYKLPEDAKHITGFGRILRKSSLDELPQLINVLRGEMSLVGIRPLLATELAERRGFSRVLYPMLPPGITGLWQVEGRSAVTHVDRFKLDERYVREWSLRSDLVLLARTPFAVMRHKHSA